MLLITAITAVIFVFWVAVRIIYKAFLFKEVFATSISSLLVLQILITTLVEGIVLDVDLVTVSGVGVMDTVISLLDHSDEAQ